MKFTTPVSISESPFKIGHDSPVMLMGSCFAESIGNRLKAYKFNTLKNPFGIIYNPISLGKALSKITKGECYTVNDLYESTGKWLSFDHHGSFSDRDQSVVLEKINASITEAHHHLKDCHTLFLTFGSAWVYEYPDAGIVANCHKLPAKTFAKRLLTVNEIMTYYEELIGDLTHFNPKLNIIFTVSPVRHTRDGLHENNLSKSTLLLAVNTLVEQHPHCTYFPAYELVMDELRDYRFFKEDLVHPTDMAIQYIWEKLGACFFDDDTHTLNKAIEKIRTPHRTGRSIRAVRPIRNL